MASGNLWDGLDTGADTSRLCLIDDALEPVLAVTIISDNPAYLSWPDCPLESIDVLGRVVWIGRKLV